MSSKKENPYAYPLRKKLDIIEFLCDHDDYNDDHGCGYCPLSWDVKARSLDLSLNGLISVFKDKIGLVNWRHGEDYFDASDSNFMNFLQEKYDEVESELWEWGVEGAQREVTDGDVSCIIWGSQTAERVKFGFFGRTGGHLVVTRYDGYDITGGDGDDFREMLGDIDYKDLVKLYKLTVQWDKDFSGLAPGDAIERSAAWDFFVTVCEPDMPADLTEAMRARREKDVLLEVKGEGQVSQGGRHEAADALGM